MAPMTSTRLPAFFGQSALFMTLVSSLAIGCGGSAASTERDVGGASGFDSGGGTSTSSLDVGGSRAAGGTSAYGGTRAATSVAATGGNLTDGGASSTTSTSPSGGTSTGGGATAAAGASSATECLSLVNAAPPATISFVSQAPPVPQGGVVANGTYHLTRFEMYGASDTALLQAMAITIRYTMVVSSSTASAFDFGVASEVSQAGTIVSSASSSGTMFLSGTSCNSEIACPDDGVGDTGSYSASDQGLVLMVSNADGSATALTFTRQ